MSQPDSAEALETLVRAWSECSLPFADWTHRAHLEVALWHALHYSPAEALERVRTGIQAYNLSQGVEQTPTGGYHETLTHLYMALVQDFVRRNAPAPVEQLSEALWKELAEKQVALRYYSRELLNSWEARTTFVAPDRAALPRD